MYSLDARSEGAVWPLSCEREMQDQSTTPVPLPSIFMRACEHRRWTDCRSSPLLMPNRFSSLDSYILLRRAWPWEVIVGFGIVVLGYMGLLYIGAIIVPGVGLFGHLMVQVPGSLLEWAHAPGYGILAVLLTRGLQRRAWPLAYALPVAAAAALVFGLWTEVFQGSVQGRQTTADDLVTDAIGIGLAAILILSATVRNRIVSTCPRL